MSLQVQNHFTPIIDQFNAAVKDLSQVNVSKLNPEVLEKIENLSKSLHQLSKHSSTESQKKSLMDPSLPIFHLWKRRSLSSALNLF